MGRKEDSLLSELWWLSPALTPQSLCVKLFIVNLHHSKGFFFGGGSESRTRVGEAGQSF